MPQHTLLVGTMVGPGCRRFKQAANKMISMGLAWKLLSDCGGLRRSTKRLALDVIAAGTPSFRPVMLAKGSRCSPFMLRAPPWWPGSGRDCFFQPAG